LELVLFHNDLKNLIYRESRSYQFRNIGRAKLQGWEAKAEWTFMRVLNGELSYSHVQEADPEKKLLEEVSENTWRLSLLLRTGFGAELNYRYSRLDQRSTYRADFVLPAYSVHDVNVTQKVTNLIRLRFEISNITDSNYEEELGYPAPGRQLAVGLSFRI
jgi:outer membrane cobalamin receptor